MSQVDALRIRMPALYELLDVLQKLEWNLFADHLEQTSLSHPACRCPGNATVPD